MCDLDLVCVGRAPSPAAFDFHLLLTTRYCLYCGIVTCTSSDGKLWFCWLSTAVTVYAKFCPACTLRSTYVSDAVGDWFSKTNAWLLTGRRYIRYPVTSGEILAVQLRVTLCVPVDPDGVDGVLTVDPPPVPHPVARIITVRNVKRIAARRMGVRPNHTCFRESCKWDSYQSRSAPPTLADAGPMLQRSSSN